METVPTLKRNPDGWFYIHWSEKVADHWRSRRASTRTKDPKEAMRALARHLGDGAAEPEPQTIDALLDAYEAGARLRGVKPTQLVALRPIRAAWGGAAPEDLTPEVVARYVQGRGEGHWTKGGRPAAPATVRRELASLQAALRWAVRKRLLLETKAPDIDLPPKSAPRERFLTEEETERLFKRAAEFDAQHGTKLELFCRIAVDCCARAASIEGLRWQQVDWKRGGWLDFRTPGAPETFKRRVVVPMSSGVREALTREECWHAPLPDQPVVGPVPHHLWRQFIATTPFMGLTRHDLRRTGASLLIAQGVDLLKVARMLGDDPRTVMKHYARFAPDYLADVHARATTSSGLSTEQELPT